MKKTFLFLFFILIFSTYVYGAFSGCSENLLLQRDALYTTANGNVTECHDSFSGSPEGLYNCTNINDFYLNPNGGEWITNSVIPPSYGSVTISAIDTNFYFNYLEIYTRYKSGSTSTQNPYNFTFSAFINNSWHLILDVVEFNDSLVECRNSGNWLGALTQPYCNRYDVNISNATKVKINVTDTQRYDFGQYLRVMEMMGCGSTYEGTDTCTDSDGSLSLSEQYMIKGYVEDYNLTFNDYCDTDLGVTSRDLFEYYCNDGIVDIDTFNCNSLGENYYCGNGACVEATTLQNCSYPILFCDTFDYTAPLTVKGWLPQSAGGVILSNLTPYNNYLLLNNNIIDENIYHTTEMFNTNYVQSSVLTTIESYATPIMSSEFTIYLYNSSDITDVRECFRYLSYSVGNEEIYDIAFCSNSSVYYKNSSTSNSYVQLCADCFDLYSYYDIKINSKFGKSYAFDFNSSFESNSVDIYIGNSLYTIDHFIDNTAHIIQQYSLLKPSTANITIIDDYYVMVGTDKYVDTSYNYLEQIYTPPSTNITVSGGTGDFLDSINSIWYQFGLRSTGSRALFALLLMFFTAIGYVIFLIAMMSQYKIPIPISAIILLLLEFFEILIFTYLGLIRLWIIVVISIVSILIVILMLITRARGG